MNQTVVDLSTEAFRHITAQHSAIKDLSNHAGCMFVLYLDLLKQLHGKEYVQSVFDDCINDESLLKIEMHGVN